MWVYLPAESLVRRISGSSKFASFMRSDLSNEDIQNLDDVDEYDYLLQGEENVDGIDCYVLERTPKRGKRPSIPARCSGCARIPCCVCGRTTMTRKTVW